MNVETDAKTLSALEAIAAVRGPFEPIPSHAPDAIARIEARIAALEAGRRAIRQVNAALRLASRDKKIARLIELGCMADCAEHVSADPERYAGFSPFLLGSLGQSIARLKTRVEAIKREQARPEAEDQIGEGYRVVENAELNRLQIVFNERPSEAVRTSLKRNGFRWAPTQNAWQRHLNQAGRSARDRVLRDRAAMTEREGASA